MGRHWPLQVVISLLPVRRGPRHDCPVWQCQANLFSRWGEQAAAMAYERKCSIAGAHESSAMQHVRSSGVGARQHHNSGALFTC